MSSLETGKAECPFTGQGESLVNVKFFRGTRDDVITAQEINEQARHAAMQLRMGTATVSTEAPRSAHPSIDVARFVTEL